MENAQAQSREPDVLRVVLVDDDPLARRGLRRILADMADVAVVGECADATQVLGSVNRLGPDAVLLDIEMPGQSGFEIAESLRTREGPYVIFVTAYDRYAVEAFNSQALDYVLKPVSRERLADAIGRARRQRETGRLVRWAHQVRAVVGANGSAGPQASYLTEFLVRVALREIVVPAAEVDWIQADSYYARLHVGPREYLLREPLQRLEQRLDPREFVRVHRSAIVNARQVREVRHETTGERTILLATGAKVRVSRTRWRWLAHHLRERTRTGAGNGATA